MNVPCCQIACRGVSHTPESVHVDKLVHPGVCDTPLHWLFAVFNIIFRKPILFYYKQGLKSICMGREADIACIFP